MKRLAKVLMNLFIWFFILLTFFLVYLSFFHKELLVEYIEHLKLLIKNLWYWNYVIIFISAFLESFPLLWISLPWQTILIIIAGFLGYKHIYFSILLAFLWAILWNYVWYLLGIKYWDKFFLKYWNLIWIWQTDVKYIKKWIDKYGWAFVVLGKFHNLLRTFVPFIAWSSWMHKKFFMLWNIISSFIRALIMVILGVFFVENAKVIIENIWKVILVIILLIFLYIYFFKKDELKKYLDEKQRELDNIMKNNEK